jgi:coatomer subunit beta'
MLAVLQYQTAVMRGDFDAANELLPSIPESEYTKVARFLESQGFKEEALAVTTDPDHKFDLALELGQTDLAHQLMLAIPEEDKDATETLAKWKRLSDAALKETNLELCEAAGIASNDYSGLLLLYSATGNLEGTEKLAKLAAAGGKTNVAFVCYLLTGNVEACADLLISTKRLPEAAFFVRTYIPSRIDEIVKLWKADLASVSETASKALATPTENPELFPDVEIALQVEKMFLAQRDTTKGVGIPATDYLTAKDDLDLDLIALIKARSNPPPDAGETKEVDPADDEQAAATAEAEAAHQAAEEAAKREAEERAALEAAQAAAAETPAGKEDEFGEEW